MAVEAEKKVTQAKVAWSVAVCVAAVLVSRELTRTEGVCALSAADVRSAEASASREAEYLARKSATLTSAVGLATVLSELEAAKNLTERLSQRVLADAARLATLEERAEARTTRSQQKGNAPPPVEVIDAALEEARAAAREARRAAETMAEDEAIVTRAEAAEARATSALKAAQAKFELFKSEAASEARRAVDTYLGDSLRVNCDAALTKVATDAARKYLSSGGEFDYALGAAGARVVASSKPYTPPDRVVPTSFWHAIGHAAGVGFPAEAISARVSFGSCFAFAGSTGHLTVKLASPVVPTSVALEHLHASLCNPVTNANCSSAPKGFQVVSSPNEGDRRVLGTFQYSLADDRPSLQHFPLSSSSADVLDTLTLEVLSNHGHPDFTCLYRFRVHGHPPDDLLAARS